MKLNGQAIVFVPDGGKEAEGIARTTHLAISAHEGDIELDVRRGKDIHGLRSPSEFDAQPFGGVRQSDRRRKTVRSGCGGKAAGKRHV